MASPPITLLAVTISVRTRGQLPHWNKPGADYFITFRTADSISPESIAALRLSPYTPDEKRRHIEAALDQCHRGDILWGAVAETVASSIIYGARRDYILHAWCVMPNHVHLLLRPTHGRLLTAVMRVLKSVTAHNVNRLLGTSGPVWQREYFDRVVRPGKFAAVRDYILRNPERANLSNWEWVGSTLPEQQG